MKKGLVVIVITLQRRKEHKLLEEITLFKMKRSNVKSNFGRIKQWQVLTKSY